MKQLTNLLAAAAIALSSLAAVPVVAQTSPNPNPMEMSEKPGLTVGEVRKIDKEAGKITIKHGEIKHMEMPPMTMVFVAKDKSMLDKAKAGDKVRFMVILENGQMVVTDIQPAK